MHKKSLIIGFCLLCAGLGLHLWVISEQREHQREVDTYKLKYKDETSEYVKKYEQWMRMPAEERSDVPPGLDINDSKTPDEIRQAQKERLLADMDKLSAGEMTVYPFADDFYGHGWESEITKYKKHKEWSEFLFSSSIVCASIGGAITGWIILLGVARLALKFLKLLKKSVSKGNKTENPGDESLTEDSENDEKKEMDNEEYISDIPNVLVNSGWQYAGSFDNDQKRLKQRKRIPMKNRSQNENENANNGNPSESLASVEKEENKLQKVSENEKSVSGNKVESGTTATSDSFAKAIGHSTHIDTTLKDLTQQVTAIREYAANQQYRLERLQDGYDWNIIKTFCLRIIRCIDNIETRIRQLSQEDIQTTHLEEVKDELVFALESGGIEQFEPKLNTYYRGQEKIAEAIKEKAQSKDPNKKGKIEKVIKPGYQLYIDDENVKIVRPAQVRIFE